MEVKDDETYDIPDLNIYLELDKVFNIPFTGRLYMISKRRIVSLIMSGVLIVSSTFLVLIEIITLWLRNQNITV